MYLGWISFVSDKKYYAGFLSGVFYEDYSRTRLYQDIATLTVI